MANFDQLVREQKAIRITPDPILARGLLEDATERLEASKEFLVRRPKLAFESAYESVREGLEALMALYGYKTTSHEAAVSFLSRFPDFSDTEISEVDRLRVKRNDSKYYAAKIDPEEAKRDIRFLEGIFLQVAKKITSKLKQ